MTNADQTMADVLTRALTTRAPMRALVGLAMHSTMMERLAQVRKP